MHNIVGWSAWFADDDDRADVVSHHLNVADYFNSAVRAGLRFTEALEVPISDEAAARMAGQSSPVGSRIALAGLPLVLILRFAKP